MRVLRDEGTLGASFAVIGARPLVGVVRRCVLVPVVIRAKKPAWTLGSAMDWSVCWFGEPWGRVGATVGCVC